MRLGNRGSGMQSELFYCCCLLALAISPSLAPDSYSAISYIMSLQFLLPKLSPIINQIATHQNIVMKVSNTSDFFPSSFSERKTSDYSRSNTETGKQEARSVTNRVGTKSSDT